MWAQNRPLSTLVQSGWVPRAPRWCPGGGNRRAATGIRGPKSADHARPPTKDQEWAFHNETHNHTTHSYTHVGPSNQGKFCAQPALVEPSRTWVTRAAIKKNPRSATVESVHMPFAVVLCRLDSTRVEKFLCHFDRATGAPVVHAQPLKRPANVPTTRTKKANTQQQQTKCTFCFMVMKA